VIGKFRQRAILQARTLTPDGGGGFSEDWTAIAKAWVLVSPVSGRDIFGPGRNESQTRLRVTMRRNEAVLAGQRLLIGTRKLAIVAVLDSGDAAPVMTLICQERP
jgi:SPP1 family predicted phage head-tail adaptor